MVYHVKNIETGTTIMIASMSEIAEAFDFHKDAVKRIVHEVERDGISLSYKRVNIAITKSK